MDAKEDSTQVSEQDKHLFLKLKMALAVAIVRSKPRGVSARDFSETLALNLKKQDETWRRRAEELEKEVLRLRQELLLERVTRSREENTGEPDVPEVFSEDLFGPAQDTDQQMDSDSETPDLLIDTSTNTYILPRTHTAAEGPTHAAAEGPTHAAAEGPTHAASEGPTAAPYSPSHAAPGASAAALLFRETRRQPLPHVQFLQSLCALQPFSCPRPDPWWLGSAPEGGLVLEESVSQLLHSIWAVFRASAPSGPGSPGGLCPSSGSLVQACEVSASALDVHCSNRSPTVEFSKTLEEVMHGLTETLLSSDPHHQSQVVSGCLMDCLLALGHCQLLKSFLIRQIVSHLSAITDRLWTLYQSSDPDLTLFPLVPYQNCCQLMWLLEQLLLLPNRPVREGLGSNRPVREGLGSNRPVREDPSSSRPVREDPSSSRPVREDPSSSRPVREDPSSSRPIREDPIWDRPVRVDLSSAQRLLGDLQQRVFPLSQEFPLFSVCLWRVLGLMTAQDAQREATDL